MNHIVSCYGIIGAMDTEIQMIRDKMDFCRTNSLYGLNSIREESGASTWCWQSAASAR